MVPLPPARGDVATGLQDELRIALNQARKGRDRLRTVVLTSTLSDLRNREIDAGKNADDDMVRDVIARAIKQRRDAAEQMRSGGREELARREEEEAAVLAGFLPPELGEEEVRAVVREIIAEGPAAMGPVMGKLMPRIRGRFDGKDANRIVREELGL